MLVTRRYAVKVPSLRGMAPHGKSTRGRLASLARGLLANQSEHIWHSFGPWQGLVAPVLWSGLGGLVQVYPRCDPIPDGWRGMLPILEPCPGDTKAPNFGLLNGKVVRIDYDMSS